MEYPQVIHLYKYCAYNTNSLAILINKGIWVANPESLTIPLTAKLNLHRLRLIPTLLVSI